MLHIFVKIPLTKVSLLERLVEQVDSEFVDDLLTVRE
jgi:hypothetical protein